MLKYTKLLLTIFGVFAVGALHADISSVGFVHAQILELKGIDLPIPAGVTADQVNSVHYMMTQIDAVNAQNGTVTHYADGPEATMNIMSADKVIADVTELIVDAPCPEDAFCVTLTKMTASSAFSFQISARGDFTIDWGDGSAMQTLTRTNTTETTYSHTYAVAGNYVVAIMGRAISYSPTGPVAVISFYNSTNKAKMTGIKGDLGKIFPILNKSPCFYQTFRGCSSLIRVPPNLFASVQGAPSSYMFAYTFYNCSRLTGAIPSGLFAGLSGAPAFRMFHYTFYYCVGLTSIPPGLFAGISGAPAEYMFYYTFFQCRGLTGSIPPGLFSGISGAPADGMFQSTFSGCTGLTGEIPPNLFSGISGTPASGMFSSTFSNCYGLTGEISPNLFSGISGAPAESMFGGTFSGCSGLTGEIPSGLFGTISGAPARYMFSGTFDNCYGLTGEIPAGLFGTFTGAPAESMFLSTFRSCSGLMSIADGIWDLSGVTNATASSIFNSTFSGCTGLTGASPTIAAGSSVKLWEHFTTYTGQWAFSGCTNMADYASIPAVWK